MNVLVTSLIASIKVSLKHKVFRSKTKYSKHVENIVKKFVVLGVLKSYEKILIGCTPYLIFYINIVENRPMLYDIKAISKSGRKIYSTIKELKYYRGIYADVIVSTSSGLFNYNECLLNNVCGEVVCVYT